MANEAAPFTMTGLSRRFVLFNHDRQLRYTWLFDSHPILVPEQVLGKTDTDLYSPAEAAALIAAKQAVLTGGAGRQEIVSVTVNQELRQYELLLHPLRDAAGTVIGITGASLDISERVQAEQKSARLASFPEMDPNPVAELDYTGAPNYLNPAARALFTGPDGPAWQSAFFADFASVRSRIPALDQHAFEREVRLGSTWFRQQWYADRADRCFRVYAADITARKEAGEALQLAYDELEVKVGKRTAQLLGSNLKLKQEIAKRQANERQIQISNEILKLATRTISRQHYLKLIAELIKDLTECRCVGLRLLAAEPNISAAAYCGFSQEFWERENCRTRERDCGACVRALTGDPPPSERAQLTEFGSFVCNDTQAFAAGLTPELQTAYRGVCFAQGFLTVAIVPIVFHEQIIGALHLADERAQRLPPATLQLVEALMTLLGEVINRFTLIETIRENSERLEKLFANTLFSVVYLDRQFNYLKVNRAFAEIEKSTPEYFVGRNHFALYPHAENQALFQRVMDTGEPVTVLAKPFEYAHHPDWGVTYWDWGIHPVKDVAEQVEGLTFCMVDVTKRKLAELELQEANVKLLAQMRLSDIGTLAATIAHELRNPLAAIKMAAYNIKKKAPDEKLAKHLANIDKKVTESETIIDNLLYYTRIKQPRLEPMDLHALLLECAAALRERFPAAAVELRTELAALSSLTLAADALQLRELFTNLLNNAYDALPDGRGTIELTAERGPREITLRVRDTGVGIEPDDLPRLFDAFYTTKAKGTGLGLTVCYQVAQNHGGNITISGQPNRGTTVTVVLPIVVPKP